MQHNILTMMIQQYFLRRDEEYENRIEQLKQTMRFQKTDQSTYYHDLAETIGRQQFLREIAKDVNTILKLYYK